MTDLYQETLKALPREMIAEHSTSTSAPEQRFRDLLQELPQPHMRVEYMIGTWGSTRTWHFVRLDMKRDREDLTIKIPDGDPYQTITKFDRRSGITIMKAGHAQGDLGDASNCVHSYMPRGTSYGRALDSVARNHELCAFY